MRPVLRRGSNGTAMASVGTPRPMPSPVVSEKLDTLFSYNLKASVDDFFHKGLLE